MSLERYPSNPSKLTTTQESVRKEFWQAVIAGRSCGAPALAGLMSRSHASVECTLQFLRARELIPKRVPGCTNTPVAWKLQVPEEFGSDEEPVAEAPAKPRRIHPDFIAPSDVGHPFGDLQSRITELEAEIAELRRANEWLTHSDAKEYRNGTLTLNCSDMHYFDRGHLINTHRSLEQKVLALLDRFKPHKFQILINGDVVPGQGVFKNQGLESLLSDTEQQVSAASWRWKEFRDQIVEHLPKDAEESHTFLRGNHDTSCGVDTSMRLVLALRAMSIPCRYVGYEYCLDLADSGHYMVYCEHGHGNSSFNPTSNAQIVDSYRKLLSLERRGFTGEKVIRRVLHGHTHFLAVGIERAEDVKYDCTGGGHRNDRIDLGRNTRPVGWIVYVSPPGANDILSPIEVVPDKDALRSDLDDPNLMERNRAEAARCLMAWSQWATQQGILADLGDQVAK